ncbi:hypothetical protein E4U53_000345 [Claviceps sorghi]|nr:hypothetical protein E4U53_000345 [Claviceps sorghi]
MTLEEPTHETRGTDGGTDGGTDEPWTDPFGPFPEMQDPDEEARLVTLRGAVVGVLCGVVVNGANVYLGLKTGWTSSANLLGVLRRFFVNSRSARDLRLVFPSSTATALTIRGMHAGGGRAARQMGVMLWAFGLAGALRVVSPLAPGVLWEWHPFTWLRAADVLPRLALAAESWGWFLEWTPAMAGSGMLVDVDVAASFAGGALVGPAIVRRGLAFGAPASDDPYWAGLVSYSSMAGGFASPDRPSPRYWLLWPGVALMLAVSMTGG